MKQEAATYEKHVANIHELMADQTIQEYMGKLYLQDYINLGFVSLDSKEQSFNIWVDELVSMLVSKGAAPKEGNKKRMLQWISEVVKTTRSIYKIKVSTKEQHQDTSL
jgi:hypothetical protein